MEENEVRQVQMTKEEQLLLDENKSAGIYAGTAYMSEQQQQTGQEMPAMDQYLQGALMHYQPKPMLADGNIRQELDRIAARDKRISGKDREKYINASIEQLQKADEIYRELITLDKNSPKYRAKCKEYIRIRDLARRKHVTAVSQSKEEEQYMLLCCEFTLLMNNFRASEQTPEQWQAYSKSLTALMSRFRKNPIYQHKQEHGGIQEIKERQKELDQGALDGIMEPVSVFTMEGTHSYLSGKIPRNINTGALDQYGQEYAARQRRREEENIDDPQFRYWNLTDSDMTMLDVLMLRDEKVSDESVLGKESGLDQTNEALRLMKDGDYSKFNHLPVFLREYFARKSLMKFFDGYRSFPPLSEPLKQRMAEKAYDPVFRCGIQLLINRKLFIPDDERENLISYDKFLNSRLLMKTMAPLSEEQKTAVTEKFGTEKGAIMIRNNTEKTVMLAKTLFLMQLGRFDVIGQDGSVHAFDQEASEAIAHGCRTHLVLPPGSAEAQQRMYDAYQIQAMQTGAMWSGRFASHDLKRRKLDGNGHIIRHYQEIKYRWKQQLKNFEFKKVTTYTGNYGINLSLGGLGNAFSKHGMVDDEGAFGHLYMKEQKGDTTHCGAILFGFENSAPKKESCVGQLHNFQAIRHDTSSFFSSQSPIGKEYGGREIDLSHIAADDLTAVLQRFDQYYRNAPDNVKMQLNEVLGGKRMTAAELRDLLKTIGFPEERAKAIAEAGRSPQDVRYDDYAQELYQVG